MLAYPAISVEPVRPVWPSLGSLEQSDFLQVKPKVAILWQTCGNCSSFGVTSLGADEGSLLGYLQMNSLLNKSRFPLVRKELCFPHVCQAQLPAHPRPLCKSRAIPCAATLSPPFQMCSWIIPVSVGSLPPFSTGTSHGTAWGGRGENAAQGWPLPHFNILYPDKRKSHFAHELCPVFSALSVFIHAPFVTFRV